MSSLTVKNIEGATNTLHIFRNYYKGVNNNE
nr:MAG TPA: hypothetical protein [Caudoviricetes sp.]